MTSFSLAELLAADDIATHINENCDINTLQASSAQEMLDITAEAFDYVHRFDTSKGIEYWVFEVNLTDDEGIEMVLYHDSLDIIAFIISDDESYTLEEVVDLFGLDELYFENYTELLQDQHLIGNLLHEVNAWMQDSFWHKDAYAHLSAVLDKGYELAPFQNEDLDNLPPTEMTIDADQIFVGRTDDLNTQDTIDYNLTHEEFNPNDPEASIEQGTQAWELVAEDSDWDDDIEEEEFDEWDEDTDEWVDDEEV